MKKRNPINQAEGAPYGLLSLTGLTRLNKAILASVEESLLYGSSALAMLLGLTPLLLLPLLIRDEELVPPPACLKDWQNMRNVIAS